MNGDNKNRAILFRGKASNGDGWVEGSYMEHYFSSRHGRVSAIFWNEDSCCQTYRTPVKPETVGQYTGRIDKNGVMIFEGDIVRSSDPDYPESKMDCGIGQVEFYAGLWYVSGEVQNGLYDLLDTCCKDLEVVGNVFDNPELLEV